MRSKKEVIGVSEAELTRTPEAPLQNSLSSGVRNELSALRYRNVTRRKDSDAHKEEGKRCT